MYKHIGNKKSQINKVVRQARGYIHSTQKKNMLNKDTKFSLS